MNVYPCSFMSDHCTKIYKLITKKKKKEKNDNKTRDAYVPSNNRHHSYGNRAKNERLKGQIGILTLAKKKGCKD